MGEKNFSSPQFTIDFSNNEINDAGVRRPMRSKERRLLDYFVANNGQLLSLDQIADAVWGAEGCSDANIQDTVSKMRSRFPSLKDCLETFKGIGYRFQLPPNCVVIPACGAEAEPTGSERLPHSLTRSSAALETSRSVLHREAEIRALEQLLAEGPSALLLSSPGGVGKSALARVLYAKLSLRYDSVGWVQYHQDLRASLLASLDLYDSMEDADKRWACIAKRLRNDLSSKLLIIDNVDLSVPQNQDPLRDTLLQEITGWPNLTVILTSRMAELPGYHTVPVRYLGSEAQPGPCAELFYYYYARRELERPAEERYQAGAVLRLIKYAGYHTYAIELLARSAQYEDDLDRFADRIEALGFRFPDQEFYTSNRKAVATAAGQLRLLFDRRERSAQDQRILWDFSLLPENTLLPAGEVRQLLGYSPNELQPLCRDGWLLFELGQGFHIHPLVREAVHLDLQNGKAPCGAGGTLVSLVLTGQLIDPKEPQTAIEKKLLIAESAAKYLSPSGMGSPEDFYYSLAMMEFRFARKRLTAIHCLQKAYASGTLAPTDRTRAQQERFAQIAYQLGYLKSTTSQHRHDAHTDLRTALELWASLDGHESEMAMAHDHLGYVLSDDEASFDEAHDHLLQAMAIRQKLAEQSPSEETLRDWATTCDNLGCLYAKWPEKASFAEALLMQAYTIRERIFRDTGEHITDAAWTAFNLGRYFSALPDRRADAELYLRRALDMRRTQERERPGMYTANVVVTLTALAGLLMTDPPRFPELCALTDEAARLWAAIDSEHTGFFSHQIESDLSHLRRFIAEHTGE